MIYTGARSLCDESDVLYAMAVWFQFLKLQNNLSGILKKKKNHQDMSQSAE